MRLQSRLVANTFPGSLSAKAMRLSGMDAWLSLQSQQPQLGFLPTRPRRETAVKSRDMILVV